MASFVPAVASLQETVFESRQTADHGAAAAAAQPEPLTAAQQAEALRAEGQSVSQIAVTLGQSQTQVDTDLGITPASTAAPVSALSVHI